MILTMFKRETLTVSRFLFVKSSRGNVRYVKIAYCVNKEKGGIKRVSFFNFRMQNIYLNEFSRLDIAFSNAAFRFLSS